MDKNKLMQLAYDSEGDVLYLSVGAPRAAISREIGDDVLLRVDPETDEVVGITILNLSKRPGYDVMSVEVELRKPA